MKRIAFVVLSCLTFAVVAGCGAAVKLTRDFQALAPSNDEDTRPRETPPIAAPTMAQDLALSDSDARALDARLCRQQVPDPVNHHEAYGRCTEARRDARAEARRVISEQQSARSAAEAKAAADRERQIQDEYVQTIQAREAERVAEANRHTKEMETIEAEETANTDALMKRCGKDYMRVHVGMAWKRVRDCAGPFERSAEDQTGVVYESANGYIRVERGVVVRVIVK